MAGAGPAAACAPEELRARLCLFVRELAWRGERERWRVTGAACAEAVTASIRVVNIHARERDFEAMVRLQKIKKIEEREVAR